ncbi:MAG: type VI secretion system contractile sheath large subunit, partial [Pirellulaceae bacterium]
MSSTQTESAGGAAVAELSLMDQILDQTRPLDDSERNRNATYIEQFVRKVVDGQTTISKDVVTTITSWIAEIDHRLSIQLAEVMHSDEFQKLEGTWRGLHYLTQNSETGTGLKIRVMNVKKDELRKDLEKAVEFDQSTLFRKCYEEEYGQLGGEPYGMLLGDYHFGRTADDVNLLRLISNVAAAGHAPFVAAADPNMFNMNSFTELSGPRDLAKIFQGADYAPWRSFRESEDSRYVALTLPNVLGRLPYGGDFKKVESFDFDEQVDGTDHKQYLWMSAAWAYATRVTDAF